MDEYGHTLLRGCDIMAKNKIKKYNSQSQSLGSPCLSPAKDGGWGGHEDIIQSLRGSPKMEGRLVHGLAWHGAAQAGQQPDFSRVEWAT